MSQTFKYRDLGAKKKMAAFKELSELAVVVGYPGDGPMHASADGEKSNFTVAQLAVVHEFGSPVNNVPARPFMQQTWWRNRHETKKKSLMAFYMAITAHWSPKQALQNLGLFYEDKVRDTIDNGYFRPLKQATIEAKGSSKPLIDTGDLRRRVATKVVRA